MTWAKEIYVATNNGIYYTNNFEDPNIQPTWTAINNGLATLEIGEFHLDPFHQPDRQYAMTGSPYSPNPNILYRRFMGGDWEQILSNIEFGQLCLGDDLVSSRIYGFCTDPEIDGRLWVVGKNEGHGRNYGPFGPGPYLEDRAAWSDDYGETWNTIGTWWSGWNPGTPSSIRSYGNTLYIRDGGGVGDRPYIEFSYNMGSSFSYVVTDLVQYTLGGFLNPLTPGRFYYDTNGVQFRYFEGGQLYETINGIKLGDNRWDTIWYNEDEINHMRLVYNQHVYTTYDGWDSCNSPSPVTNMDGYSNNILSLSPYAGDNSDYIILGLSHVQWGPDTPCIAVLYGDNDTVLSQIAGENWNTAPYINSIPENLVPCRCGIQGVHKIKGYVYVNAVAMPNFSENVGGGVPMDGDRSAWNARYYQRRHANDINSASATSMHHTLSAHFVTKTTGSYKAAPGDHSHYLRDLDSGSSLAGEILTSLGTGSPTWHTLSDHSHAGSAIGDGGRFNADHLSSGSATINSALTYESGNITWKPISNWKLSLIEDINLNDSDKQFSVPAGVIWQILWAWVEYSSTSTSGSRQVEIQIQDTDNTVISQWQAGITQNSNSNYKYLFGMVIPDLTSLRDGNYLMTPIPSDTFLTSGQKIRIWDNKSIDSTNDDIVVRIQYTYRPVT